MHTRRSLLKLAGAAAVSVTGARAAGPVSLFDGKTLDGWLQIENSATSLSTAGIADPAAFVARLSTGQDAVSAYLRSQFEESVKADAAAYSAENPNAKTIL